MAASTAKLGNEAVLLRARLENLRQATHPHLNADEFLLINSVDSILRSRQLSYQQIEDGIVDGADDGGVDALYIFINGVLVEDDATLRAPTDEPTILVEIVQTKNESGFSEAALNTLIANVELMFSYVSDTETDRSCYNPRLRERLRLFRHTVLGSSLSFAALQFNVRYITRAENDPHPKVRAKAEQLCSLFVTHHPQSKAEFFFVGAAQLNSAARDRAGRPSRIKMSDGPIGGDLGGWVGLCAIIDYLKFITGEEGGLREEIFEENVRGFEGNTMINRDISASLGVRPKDHEGPAIADFWWLNNGVTILGSRVEPEGSRTLKIGDPQIVNGLQTSRSIFNASRTEGVDFEEVNAGRSLLVRVIEAADEEVASEIIKATNSQNRISSATLRATDRSQRAVEEYFLSEGYYYERKKNHYKSAGKPRTRIVEVLEVAQAVWAIQQCEPHAARGGPSRLVSNQNNYRKIFSEKVPFKGLLVCIKVVRVIDDFLREQGLSQPEASNIRFHLARVSVAFFMRSSRPRWAALQEISSEELRNGPLLEIYDWLMEIRNRVSEATSRTDWTVVAKGPQWTEAIDEKLSYFTDKTRWPKNLVWE
jgi:hypothetical protein